MNDLYQLASKLRALRVAGAHATGVHEDLARDRGSVHAYSRKELDHALLAIEHRAIEYVSALARARIHGARGEKVAELLEYLIATFPAEAHAEASRKWCSDCGVATDVAGGCSRCQVLKTSGVARGFSASLGTRPQPRETERIPMIASCRISNVETGRISYWPLRSVAEENFRRANLEHDGGDEDRG